MLKKLSIVFKCLRSWFLKKKKKKKKKTGLFQNYSVSEWDCVFYTDWYSRRKNKTKQIKTKQNKTKNKNMFEAVIFRTNAFIEQLLSVNILSRTLFWSKTPYPQKKNVNNFDWWLFKG